MSGISSYLEDSLRVGTAIPPEMQMAGAEVIPGVRQFSGSYVAPDMQCGMMGSAEYFNAYKNAELARFAPDTLAMSVKSVWDEPYLNAITPEKPAAVSLAGYDLFGPQSFNTSTRNMTLDPRGEAVYAPNMYGELPEGAGLNSQAFNTTLFTSNSLSNVAKSATASTSGVSIPALRGPVEIKPITSFNPYHTF